MPTIQPDPDNPPHQLARTLGVPQIVFMVVAMAAPLTVVAGVVPLMVALGNGSGVPLNFVLVGAVLLLFTVGFSAITPEIEDAGAFSSYVNKGLGSVAGLGAAALAVTTYALLLVAVCAYLGAASRSAISSLTGADVPWWSLTAASIALIAFLGYRNIEMSARVLGALLVAEIAVVAALDLGIVLRGGHEGITASPLGWDAFTQGAVGTGIMFAIFGFIGFEATAVFRSEAKDPDVTIPRATYTAVLLIAGTYALSAWAVVNGAGSGRVVKLAQTDPEGLVPTLADEFVSTFAQDAMQVLLATSFFACALTAHNVVSRYIFDLGSKGSLPRRLGRAHPRHRSPHVASLVTTAAVSAAVVITIATGLDPVLEVYAWFGGAGTLGLIALLALTSLAIAIHFLRHSGRVSVWRGIAAPGLASVSLVGIAALVIDNFPLLIGSNGLAVTFGGVLVLSFLAGATWGLVRRVRTPAATSARDDGAGAS
ncbi:APC family permease [Aeromicrobium sp. Leaf350]|uniref:APC family permease n=1 Tax=Aeromicrobium sp. Leaf350 TaxID=2876565 RepID=UPI001E463353|nr:APC family permease [Aeromicrobium sp. Leaf350]